MTHNKNEYCNCLFYSANALARIMSKMAEEEFNIVQLAPSYAFLLMTVNRKPGIQPKDISEIMMLKPSTVSRLIEKMEYKGYLTRKSQGKGTAVYPTNSSVELDSKIKEAWMSLFKRYTDLIGEKESRRLTEDVYDAIIKLQD